MNLYLTQADGTVLSVIDVTTVTFEDTSTATIATLNSTIDVLQAKILKGLADIQVAMDALAKLKVDLS